MLTSKQRKELTDIKEKIVSSLLETYANRVLYKDMRLMHEDVQYTADRIIQDEELTYDLMKNKLQDYNEVLLNLFNHEDAMVEPLNIILGINKWYN